MTAAAVTSTKYSPMLEYSSHICVFWFVTVGFVISTVPTAIHTLPPSDDAVSKSIDFSVTGSEGETYKSIGQT